MEKGKDYRVNNFILRKVEEDGLLMVEARAAGGHWRMAWAETTSVYVLLDGTDYEDKDDVAGIAYFITSVYASSMIVNVDLAKAIYEAVGKIEDVRGSKAS